MGNINVEISASAAHRQPWRKMETTEVDFSTSQGTIDLIAT